MWPNSKEAPNSATPPNALLRLMKRDRNMD